jgi:hypothetical protein
MNQKKTSAAEQLAKLFHDSYEELAPSHGYETREASRKPWEGVPENNRSLMVAVAQKILDSQEDSEDLRKLRALETAGVDNWDGYAYAMSIMDGDDEF